MLDDALKKEIQDGYRQFLNSKSLKARYGQRLMIAHIARCLSAVDTDIEGKRDPDSKKPYLCVVEAGTGTGKTLAYALAAIPVARALGKSLVISTATVALQEQIVQRDLPDIRMHSGLRFNFRLAKGRGRYLCLSKLDGHLGGGVQAAMFPDEIAAAPAAESITLFQSMADALLSGKWDGDKDNWTEALPDTSWQQVTTDHVQCTGRRCAHIKNCSFFKAREDLASAEVIVANHDLVLADLALGGGAILPAPEDSIYVFDEAHHLPDKVINHFSFQVRVGATLRWLEQVEKGLGSILAEGGLGDDFRGGLETTVLSMVECRELLGVCKPLLEQLLETSEADPSRQPRLRFEHGIVPAELVAQAEQLKKAFAAVAAHISLGLDQLEQALDKRELKQPQELQEQWLALFSNIRSRSEANIGLWRSFAANTENEEPPVARWLQWQDTFGGGLDIDICSSPVLAAETLTGQLWKRCFSAVLTSATLTALGSFERFNMRTGVADIAQFEVVPSPFNHAEAGEIFVPKLAAEPGDSDGHTAAVVETLEKIVDLSSGTLVLFSSRWQMERVFDGLSTKLSAVVLVQDSCSKQELLRQHRERIDDKKGSVIFGLASFAEGVDLPGDQCSHVIIAKIPFAVPDDPVEQTLSEWVEKQGRNAFMEISVPDAALRLVQASGRLLRRESDKGRITILDRRLVTKFYGKRMLNSLPPYRRNIE
jgi:ATP-dependent DNA helicase DinG